MWASLVLVQSTFTNSSIHGTWNEYTIPRGNGIGCAEKALNGTIGNNDCNEIKKKEIWNFLYLSLKSHRAERIWWELLNIWANGWKIRRICTFICHRNVSGSNLRICVQSKIEAISFRSVTIRGHKWMNKKVFAALTSFVCFNMITNLFHWDSGRVFSLLLQFWPFISSGVNWNSTSQRYRYKSTNQKKWTYNFSSRWFIFFFGRVASNNQ